MNEKNERNLDSTVDEIMEEIREQNVSEVKDINEKEQKSEERPRKKKVPKTKYISQRLNVTVLHMSETHIPSLYQQWKSHDNSTNNIHLVIYFVL